MTRFARPEAEFRQFMIASFGNDDTEYKVVDIAELASVADDPKVAALSVQEVGDFLRSWARNNTIVQGWMCLENQPVKKGHSLFRIVRKAAVMNSAYSGPKDHELPPVAVAIDPGKTNGVYTPPASNGNGNGNKSKSFTGKIQDIKSDGSMLVINKDGAFAVRPIKW